MTAQATLAPPRTPAATQARPAPADGGRSGPPDRSADHEPAPWLAPAAVPGHDRAVRPWPLLALALPAAVTIWSGWVGIGQMTGFGIVHPLPGIWDGLRLNTAVTLPVGVEAYAAYALRAWLSASTAITVRTRQFTRRSAIGSLLLGMAGQAGYHLLAQARTVHAPWPVTMAVSCLPVLVLGMGAALAHLLRGDLHAAAKPGPAADQTDRPDQAGQDHSGNVVSPERLARAYAAAWRLAATGRPVSRRALRTAGIRGSNASLGALARALSIGTAAPGTARVTQLPQPHEAVSTRCPADRGSPT